MNRLAYIGAVTADSPGGVTVRNGHMIAELERQGVLVRLLDTGDPSMGARLRQLASLMSMLRTERQLVLSVAHKGSYALIALLALVSLVMPRLRIAVLAVGRVIPNNIRSLSGASRHFFVWCLSRMQTIHVQGEWLKAELNQLGVSNASVLPNPRPSTDARWTKRSLEGRRLIFVSRVAEDKGVEEAMTAIEILRSSGVDAYLDVFGPIVNGYQERFLNKVATHPGTAYKGVLTVQQVPWALAEHAAFILPTTWATEGSPGALIEAGLVGLPVIASNTSAITEIVEDGVSGILVDPSDPAAIAEAARHILVSPRLAEQLGDSLREVTSEFTLDKVVTRFRHELYAQGWR